MPRSAPIALVALLALAACGSENDAAGGVAEGKPVAAVPAPAGQSWSEVVTVGEKGGMVLGNPDAPIRLLEYGSLSCPGCAQFSQQGFEPLRTKYIETGKVSFEFRSFAIHPQDVPLTMMVRCAPKEAFFGLVEQIYTNFEDMNAPFRDQARLAQMEAALAMPAGKNFPAFAQAAGFSDFFAQRGISRDQSNVCLADTAKAKQIADWSQSYGDDEGITGTPTLFINGRKVDGSAWAVVEPLLQKAGAR